MAEKDYADIMFDAMSVLIDKKIEAIKFDQTINATIEDATRASEGVYVVTTGNAKFTAYSTEVEYKNKDAVLVMIPQGDYDNQKMIIGKYVDDDNTPIVYTSPFSGLVNITNNLIQGKHEIGYWANDPTAEDGRPWNIDSNDFRTSTVFANDLVIWDSYSDDTFIPCQGYTRLGVSAQFSTWLADWGAYTGNYGLAIEITFKSTETETNNSFTKIITFDSKEFFGDVYNFETYYTQENVYDISDYIDYPITRLRLFAYQRENFIGTEGRVPYNEDGGNINPNIFIKDPFLCLGIPSEDFNEDMATLMTMSTSTYYKGSLSPEDGINVNQRFNDNEKIIGLRWVHKDVENNVIKTVEPDEFPDLYEVRWYRFKLGAKSPDMFAGAHWQRLYAPLAQVDQNGDYYLTSESNLTTEELNDADEFTNQLEFYFWPNVNNETEKIKVVIVKNEGTTNNPIYRQVAQSNILEFTNETSVRNKATVIDLNALSIQFIDESGEMADCLGTYFIYDKADRVLNEGDKEIRFLQLAFDPNEPNVYEKAVLTDWSSIKWYIPCGTDTMITPASPATAEAQPIQQPNEDNYYTITNEVRVAFFVKSVLNRYAGRNTVRAEVVKDGQLYTAEAQMLFGTSGTSGSDYTIQLFWHHGKNAIDVSQAVLDTPTSEGNIISSFGDRKVLEGELALFDQNGQNITQPDFHWDIDWKVSERTDAQANESLSPAYQETDYYYPVYLKDDIYENGNLVESNYITFKRGQLNDDHDNQRTGHYYYYTLYDIFDTAGIVLTADGLIFDNITNSNKKTIFEKLSKLYYWDVEKNYFVNCIEGYNEQATNNRQITENTLTNSSIGDNSIGDAFLSFFAIPIDDSGDEIKYSQFYYKTHETVEGQQKKQLIFETLDNIYDGNEENTILYLGSQAADDVFFKTDIISISKEKFFQEIWEHAIHYGEEENFIATLITFIEKYKDTFDTLKNNADFTSWAITVGNSANTLKDSLINLNNSTQNYLRIDLIKKLLDFNSSPGLYYNGTRVNISDPDHIGNTDFLREIYFLLFDDDDLTNANVNDRIADLQEEYFYRVIDNTPGSQELLVLPLNSTTTYAYKNDNEIIFLSPGTSLTCGILKYLFNSDNIKFYEVIENDAQSTTTLKNDLKKNFVGAQGDLSTSWEKILSSLIDYKLKNVSEIQNTNLSSSFLLNISQNQKIDLKSYIIDQMQHDYDLKQILIGLKSNNYDYDALIHNQDKLNNSIINGILNTSNAQGSISPSDYTPGFQKTEQYNSVISKEKQKWFLEENFQKINDEEIGGIFVLDAIREGKMRPFSELKNSQLLSSINTEKIVVGTNPDSSSWYDYVNILFQLQFYLRQQEETLLKSLKAIHNNNNIIIGPKGNSNSIEFHIINAGSANEYSDEDYLYGKLLFRYIKSFLNSASGNKFILEEVNNLGLLFKLMFKENFYEQLSNSSRFSPLEDSMGFFTRYLTSQIIEENATCASNQINNIAYIGNFTYQNQYYSNEFLSTVSEDPNSTLLGIDFLDYCASKQEESYEKDENDHVIPDSSETPTITINIQEKTIQYTGPNTIKKPNVEEYFVLTNLQSLLKNWIETQASNLFIQTDELTLQPDRNIFSIYDFKRSGGVEIGFQVKSNGTIYQCEDPNYDYFKQQYQSNQITILYSSLPFNYIQYTITDADDQLVCVIGGDIKSPEKRAEVFYNGNSVNTLSYKSLCNLYFPNNGLHPDFLSLLMHLILSFWQSNNSIGILSSLFGQDKVKTPYSSKDGFGQSNILIFFPYEAYDIDSQYFASINKILQNECIVDNVIVENNVYTNVLQKINLSGKITTLSPDDVNLFYIMLMKLLFIDQSATDPLEKNWQNVDSYYSNDAQNQLTLDILLSKEDIFWQCYNCVFNVQYPLNNSDGNYQNSRNENQNIFNDFAADANAKYLEVIDIAPDLRKTDQLQTKMFQLLYSYAQRKNFYQYQQLQNNNLEILYQYLISLCFKGGLDFELYQQAYCNVKANDSPADNEPIETYLKHLYLKNETSLALNEPTAEQWINTIINSMQYPPYTYECIVGTSNAYDYYIDINDSLQVIKDLINYHESYSIQGLYTHIYYLDFYKLANVVTPKRSIVQSIINNNTIISEAIPTTEKQLLQSLLKSLVYNKDDDVALYNKILAALSGNGLDIENKQWYYKIENGTTKDVKIGLFGLSDPNEFLNEVDSINNDSTKFYSVDPNGSNEIYFNYYNPWYKKAFIKRNGVYILDPYDNFSLYETYYYPLESDKTVNKTALLEYVHEGGNTFLVRPKADASTDVLLKSLNILQVALRDFGDYDLTAFFPIPLRNGTEGNNTQINYQVRYIEGADRVWYPITGQPEYYQNPYRLFAQRYENGVLQNFEEIENITWEPIYYQKPNEHDNFVPTIENNLLKPIVLYVKEAKNYGVICKKDTTILWSQPIYVYQDRYPSTTVNKWNGTDIVLDDKSGMVLASAFAAGKKDKDNKFSGVLLGDFSRDVASPELSAKTGIYGFHKGETAYAFMEDGTGYIGKEGKGRIWFDGEKSQIYSSNWEGNRNLGMLLDIDDGYINMRQHIAGYNYYEYSAAAIEGDITGKKEINPTTVSTGSTFTNIDIDSSNNRYALEIYSDSDSGKGFRVGWAGDVHIEKGSLKGAYIEGSLIKGSDIFANYLQADRGWLGGWVVNSSRISSPPVGQSEEEMKSWTELSPTSGIRTNRIKIETVSSIDQSTVTGVIGFLKGYNEIEDTTAVGMSSDNKLIFKSSGADVALKAGNEIWIEASGTLANGSGSYGRVALRSLSGNASIIISSEGIKITGSQLNVENIAPDNQHGIYACFG